MWGFSNHGLEGIWRSDAVKDAMELQHSRQHGGCIFHALPYHLCRASKKLGWIHREVISPHARTQYSCKGWCKLQMSTGSCLFGFNGRFLSPSEADFFFFWTLWGSPCSVLLSGKPCLNDVTDMVNDQGTHNGENGVLTNWEDCGWWGNFALDALKPLLLHSKGIQDN